MLITCRATFEEICFPDDSDDHEENGGWVDPRNPWGSFKQYRDDDSAEPDSITFDNIADAVEFAADFPGGIWDYSESESTMDSRTGVWESRTLHVEADSDDALIEFFNALEKYEKERDNRLMQEKRSMPRLVHVEFDWSTEFGKCYDCGLPAAYSLNAYLDGETNRYCAICAAQHAADGETITWLFAEKYN